MRHPAKLSNILGISYILFLVHCGHFELSGANDFLKQCHIPRSDKPLKWNHYINVLQCNYFIQRNTWYCKKGLCFVFSCAEMPLVISDIRFITFFQIIKTFLLMLILSEF